MFGLVGDAESDHGAWLAGTNLRVSQLFEQAGGWYLKPMVDLNAMRIGTESFREHGAGGANLAVEGNETWVLTASPAIEIGAEITVEGIVYRPYFRAGGTFFSDATFDMTASFIAAPGHSFKTSTEFDDSYVDIAAGVDILTADGVDLKLTYDGRFSENSDLHAGGVKAAIPF
jgi:outer membrane autotransporter protein